MKCSKCGSKDIDFQESGGQSICVNCGTVLEENTIVSSIEFQESGDRSHVVGQFVSASCSKPYMSGARGMGRHGDSRDSRDTTLVNARRAISQVAISLRLPNLYVDRAYRLYQLALQRNFIFGRRQAHVVATCLYIICRQEKSPHLLIDFSDALQVNVYVLGKSFLQFSKILNLNLPVVDPSLYIHRYATRLELGEKMSGVVTTALRIVTRLKKDWIATGRRPDGICAVALLIATRAYGFNISQGVVAKIFRISGDTLKRRLDDFRATPSAQLTLVQFNLNDLDVEFDPPAFIRNVVDGAGDPGSIALSLTSSDQNAMDSEGEEPKDLEEDEVFRSVPLRIGEVDVEVPVPGQSTAKALSASAKSKEAARSALYSTIYSQAMLDASAQANEQHVDALLNEAQLLEGVKPPKSIDEKKRKRPAAASASKASKASSAKMNRPTALLVGHTAHIDLTAVNEGDEDQLLPEILDTDDNSYLLTQDEQQKRSSIWEKNFRPFMDERDRRRQARERENGESSDKYTINGKLRKKYTKRLVVDANTTTSHSVLSTGASVKGSSKKINYDALKGVFGGDGGFAAPEALNKAAVVNNKVAQVKAPPTSKLSGTTVADNTKKSSDVVNSVTFSSATVDNSKAKSVAVADEPDDEEEDNLMYEDEGNGGDYEYDDDYY